MSSLSGFVEVLQYEVEDRRMRRRRNQHAYAKRCATLPWPALSIPSPTALKSPLPPVRARETQRDLVAEAPESARPAIEAQELPHQRAPLKLGPMWEEPDKAPKFTFHLRPRLIQLNHPCKLICCVQGKPVPDIRWFKDGREVNQERCQVTNKHGVSTLELYNCREDDAGRYSCTADSPLGSDETSCVVSVQGRNTPGYDPLGNRSLRAPGLGSLLGTGDGLLKAHSAMDVAQPLGLRRGSATNAARAVNSLAPSSRTTDDSSVPSRAANSAPAFPAPLADLVVDAGQSAEFSCRIAADPTPSIEWLHNGERLSNPRAVPAFSGGRATLAISATVPEDAGEYVCRANNVAGSEASKARLTVLAPRPNSPAPPLTNGLHANATNGVDAPKPPASSRPHTTQGFPPLRPDPYSSACPVKPRVSPTTNLLVARQSQSANKHSSQAYINL